VSARASALPVTYIRPGARSMSFTLREIWQARELLYFLVWRDIKVRYKQTVLGIGWSVLQPFLTMVVFTIFFGRLAKVPSDGVPYPVFSLAALCRGPISRPRRQTALPRSSAANTSSPRCTSRACSSRWQRS
jgi:hypothetical protein